MVLVQNWPFFQLFLCNIGQENVFYDILERKNAFLGYTTSCLKSRKIYIFFRGSNPWVWTKNGLFSNIFFLGNVLPENVYYDILERKKDLFWLLKQKVKKVKKLTFFQRG